MTKLTTIAGLKSELGRMETSAKALEKVRTDAAFDLATDNLGHFLTHLQNLSGTLRVLRGQVEDWETREKAKDEE